MIVGLDEPPVFIRERRHDDSDSHDVGGLASDVWSEFGAPSAACRA